jgi:hypothetical protein
MFPFVATLKSSVPHQTDASLAGTSFKRLRQDAKFPAMFTASAAWRVLASLSVFIDVGVTYGRMWAATFSHPRRKEQPMQLRFHMNTHRMEWRPFCTHGHSFTIDTAAAY